MESLAPALLPRLVPLTDYLPRGCRGRHPGPRARRDPGAQPRRDEPRVPRRRVERRDRGRPGADRPRRRRLPHRERPARRGRSPHLVDAQPLRLGRRRRHPARRRSGADVRRPGGRRPRPRRRARPRRLAGHGHGQRRRARRARRRGARRSRCRRRRRAGRRSRPGSSSPTTTPDGRGIAVISESEFYGRSVGIDSRQVKRLASRRKNVVDPLQLQAGDFVVHQTHGIGRFVELVQREVASGTRTPRGPLGTTVTEAKVVREYLVIEYAPSKRGYPGRQALRADRPARPAHPLRRRRGARAVEDGRIRLGRRQGQGAQGGARHRRRAGQALQRADGVEGPRVPARHARGSASSRRRSRSSRRPTSSSRSTR